MLAIQEKNSDIFSEPVAYTPVKGDVVDERLERFLKRYEVRIPMIRLAENRYLFGTTIIALYIVRDKLVVRLKTEYQHIEKYVQKNARQEADRIKQKMSKHKKTLSGLMESLVKQNKPKK